MANVMTLNERVKQIVKQVVFDDDYKKLQNASKDVEDALANDGKFVSLKKSLDDYRLKAYAEDKAYQECSRRALRTAFRAASKCVHGIVIPFSYTDDEKTLKRLSQESIANTDARIASLICRVNERFEERGTRLTRERERIPYTISEIRKLVELMQLGILEREQVREQVKGGKVKR